MLLSEGLMRTVFLVFGGFWVVILIALYLGLGVLVKRQESSQHSSH